MAEQQIISAVASSSNSSSTVSPKKYHVFLSFRGEDTRKNFTSHLHEALKLKKVETYIDYLLERGDEISPALIKAIKDSHISVVILSKNYASSKWCLEELRKILKCRKKQGQIVKPIFYNIDPSHVRKQTGSYKKAFAKHEGDPRCNKWKAALTEVANLAGWDSRDRTESELVKEIVEDILQKLTLTRRYPNQLNGLVGIEENYERIESLLKFESEEVKTIGIWGMGGIGKTTLARALYDNLSFMFEASCFLQNVTENSAKHGCDALRAELFSQLLEQKYLATSSLSTFDKHRLGQKKVLIVLDDVTTSVELKHLTEEKLGAGSRVIVTTRDKQIFRLVDEVYEVKRLNVNHSLQLFCLNAFEGKQPEQGYEYLSRRAISYCSGIPLALEVLGASLRQRNIKAWKSELEKLEMFPIKNTIQKILQLSYDGLDDSQKGAFLDIACFLKGERRDSVTRVLQACGFFPDSEIPALLDKALITISLYDRIEMHDLIQQMGREIVRQESTKDPGERSRLWKHEEVCEVLKVNTGTDVVQGIALDLYKLIGDLELDSDSFTKMTKLRFLKIHDYLLAKKFNVYFPRKGLTSLSNKLRYLQWDRCCLESLPSNFCAEQLVELHMKYSKVKKLWDGVQNLVNLKVIDLSSSPELIEISDLSKAEKLETVNLNGCKNLSGTTVESLAANIKFLPLLKTLHLDGCSKLVSLAELPPSLHYLQLQGCSKLVSLPELPPSLHYLKLQGCSKLMSLPELPPLLSNLRLEDCNELVSLPELPPSLSLRYLQLQGCSKLVSLPELPPSLHYLELRGCSKLVSLPELPPLLSNLKLEGCNELVSLPELPPSLSLSYLRLQGCSKLVSLPELPPSLHYLQLQGCSKLVSLPELPPLLSNLQLEGCNELVSLPELPPSLSLRCLRLQGCSKLVSLPELPPSLHYLELQGCSKLVSLSELPPLLSNLKLEGCNELVSLPELPPSLSLRYLLLQGCSKLVSLPELPSLLSNLRLEGCNELVSLPELPPSLSLSYLRLQGCSKLVSLPELPPSLHDLKLQGCSELVSLPELPPSLSLRYLQLQGCSKLVSLPELPPSLHYLQLQGCSKLVSLPELPPSLHYLKLQGCSELVSLPELPPLLSNLRLEGCNELVSLPELPPSLSLSYLRLQGCSKLVSLPELPPSLHYLQLQGCSKLVSLPELPLLLSNLQLEGCNELVSLPELPPSLSLRCLQLQGCSKLVSLPELPPSLYYLQLQGCSKLMSLPELPPSLFYLELQGCSKLVSLPELPPSLSLCDLQLQGCSKLVSLPELPPSLYYLQLQGCSKLMSLPELPPSLFYLELQGCSKLVSLPELPPSLHDLKLQGCSELVSLPELPPSLSLRDLQLQGCSKLVSLPELPPSLNHLELQGCRKLVSLPKLPSSLIRLWLKGCRKLVSLPKLPPSLHHLQLQGCSKLVSLPKFPPSLEILSTINCTSLDTDFTQQLLLQQMLQPGPLSRQESKCNLFILPGEHVTDKCEFRTVGSSIAIPSLPLSHPESHLHAFISYVIYSAGLFKGRVCCSIYHHGEIVGWRYQEIWETNFISDHVVLFYVQCKRSHVFKNDLPFEFKFDIHDQAERIRECGVFPVYALESGGLKLFDRSSKQILDSESISQMFDNESQHTGIGVGGSNSQHEKEW